MGSLQDKVKEKGRIEESFVSIYAKQILKGLQQLHRNDFIHNNLKPSNILLFEKSGIKLSDYAINDLLTDKMKKGEKNFNWMNFPFTAPEVVKNIGKFPLSDIWSLGCVLIYML